MGIIFTILSIVAGIGSLVCLVLVLLKMFPAEGALKGVLGIICGLYTFIWGWQNRERFGLQTVMTAWTVLIVVSIIINVIGSSMAAAGAG